MIPYVEDLTQEQAHAKFFSHLREEDIAAYLVSYTTPADWHSEMHEAELWLPEHWEEQQSALEKIQKLFGLKVYEVEELP